MLFSAVVVMAASSRLNAAPYASNIQVSGTTVNFILNEPTDLLNYSINGGAAVTLDGTTKGMKSFMLGAPTDMFSIIAEKNAATGFTIPTGATIANGPSALSQTSNEAGLNVVSDDTNPLGRYNSPRGVNVSNDANAPHFGTTYIANSAAGSVAVNGALPARTLTDEGLYALRADQTDAFGYGDVAKNPVAGDGFPAFSTASSNSPYRVFVAANGDIFVADYSDINGNVFKIDPMLTASQIMLAGIGGPAPPVPPTNPDGTGLPAGQNHGSISSLHIEGTFAGNDLVMYAVDEDLNSAHFTPGGVQNDRNSVWRWDIGGTPPATGSTVTPTKIGGGLIGDFPAGGILIDMSRGADGKFYLSQNRSAGNQVGIQVLDPTGVEVFNSLTKSRELLGPTAVDIFTNVLGIAVSEDQKWLAAVLNIGDVAVIPLVDGIPDIANRMVVNTDPNVISGRDITFDAAGNIHYVSSGQAIYRVLAPGGHTIATTSFNGTSYAFNVQTIAPPGGLPGDYNENGTVDAADYVAWRKAGPTDTLPNDPSPGTVDQSDYDLWRANFGNTTPASGSAASLGVAVPEPGTFALALLAMLGIGSSRARRQSA